MISSVDDVTAFILAGGKSARMGSDKAFLELKGRTLLERALDTALALTPEAIIVGERSKFARFGIVVEDVFRERGPLGGIHAALRNSATDINLMLAVDMPFVSWALLRYLISHAEKSLDASAVVPRSKEGWQPLCAIYRRTFADAAEEALRAGENKIDRLFEKVRVHAIGHEELESAGFSNGIFRNLNTPDELQASAGLTASKTSKE